MGIEVTQDGTIVATGDGVLVYRLLALRSMLKLEITGLKHSSGSVAKRIRDEFGLKSRNKQKLLEEYESMLKARGVLV
jgi:hypothetical protein